MNTIRKEAAVHTGHTVSWKDAVEALTIEGGACTLRTGDPENLGTEFKDRAEVSGAPRSITVTHDPGLEEDVTILDREGAGAPAGFHWHEDLSFREVFTYSQYRAGGMEPDAAHRQVVLDEGAEIAPGFLEMVLGLQKAYESSSKELLVVNVGVDIAPGRSVRELHQALGGTVQIVRESVQDLYGVFAGTESGGGEEEIRETQWHYWSRNLTPEQNDVYNCLRQDGVSRERAESAASAL